MTREGRVRSVEIKVAGNSSRLCTSKNTGKITKRHRIILNTQKYKIEQSKGIEAMGELAKAKIDRKARVEMLRL